MKKYILYTALACPLSSHDLSSIDITYWGTDQKSHTGILVVNKNIADDTQKIFQEIYKIKFPIEKIAPLSDYKNNEEQAMEDNDSFGYHCKKMTSNSNLYSKHAYGLAVDINPEFNPYINARHNILLPKNSEDYANRENIKPGMITKNSPIYSIFLQHHWKWGGDWKSIKDYHHFETDLTFSANAAKPALS